MQIFSGAILIEDGFGRGPMIVSRDRDAGHVAFRITHRPTATARIALLHKIITVNHKRIRTNRQYMKTVGVDNIVDIVTDIVDEVAKCHLDMESGMVNHYIHTENKTTYTKRPENERGLRWHRCDKGVVKKASGKNLQPTAFIWDDQIVQSYPI